MSYCFLLFLQKKVSANNPSSIKKITLTSSAFKNNGMMPKKYSCNGENISPTLSWTEIPKNTKSISIICNDLDAPAGIWVHWVIFNIPPDKTELPENIPAKNPVLKIGKFSR